MNGNPFYRGLSDPDDSRGSAPVFASTQQLDLLKVARDIYFDATFKVVRTVYRQLFTIFVSCAYTAFPAVFRRISTSLCRTYITVDSMADSDRIRRGIEIRRSKKKRNIHNDVRIELCIERYGAYTRLQFLKAISRSLGADTEAFQVTSEDDSDRDADAVTTSQSSTPLRLPLLQITFYDSVFE